MQLLTLVVTCFYVNVDSRSKRTTTKHCFNKLIGFASFCRWTYLVHIRLDVYVLITIWRHHRPCCKTIIHNDKQHAIFTTYCSASTISMYIFTSDLSIMSSIFFRHGTWLLCNMFMLYKRVKLYPTYCIDIPDIVFYLWLLMSAKC